MREPTPDQRGGRYEPTLYLYEHCPGGTGLAERIYEQRAELLARARRLVVACACASGCPACVGPTLSIGPSVGSRKALAVELLGGRLPVGDRADRPVDEQRRVASRT
jgi:DEAD/DEAH box helicase domain-containing protein